MLDLLATLGKRIPVLGLCLGVTLAAGCRGPSPGLFASRYVKAVSTNAEWLVEPASEPEVRTTDDMDRVAREMRERGYVMIGYSTFNSIEGMPEPVNHAYYDQQRAMYEAMDPEIGEPLIRNIEMQRAQAQAAASGGPRIGDPYAAGMWARAAVVYYQEGYAFNRVHRERRRELADEVRSRRSIEGGSDARRDRQLDGATTSTTTVDSERQLRGGYESSEWDVGGSVGRKGISVGGGYGESEGTHYEDETYEEDRRFEERRTETEVELATNRYYESLEYESTHWAMATVEQDVDHYDYVATFWKKLDPTKVPLGVATAPVPEELWPDTGTRHGRLVTAVWGGTPAFRHEVWEGDVLLAIAGERIVGEGGFRSLLDRHQGTEVALTIWRDGRRFESAVPLQRTR